MNADPAVPYLQGAAFDLPGKEVFIDKKNKIQTRIVEKSGNSYKIRIGNGKPGKP
jgi:hypothetical protein